MTTDTRLSLLRDIAKSAPPDMSVMVAARDLMALVECAEAAIEFRQAFATDSRIDTVQASAKKLDITLDQLERP